MAALGGQLLLNGAAALAVPPASAPPLPSDGQGKIEEYKKIVRFRDAVLSGAHPRIKPASAKSAADDVLADLPLNSLTYQANSQRPPISVSSALPGLGMLLDGSVNGAAKPAAAKPVAAAKPEINPVLLEKSDDLIKAEFHLQRQRLERGLKDQIEQKRAALKASQQGPESLSEMDLVDVLSRAMVLVQTTVAQPTNDTAANTSTESDSFDDNTFYSSRHDTPEGPQVSRVLSEPADEQMREDSYEPQLDPPPILPAQDPMAIEPPLPAQDAPSSNRPNLAAASRVPGIGVAAPYLAGGANTRMGDIQAVAAIELTSSSGSGPASRSEDSGNTNTAFLGGLDRVSHNLLGQALNRRDSPLVRAHNLSPIAPQPEHVSPLVVSRQHPIPQPDASARQATPPQVAALRREASAGTTPESSPQASKNDKRKKKKKKKAERLAEAAAAFQSPYIKPEPRSPSPPTAQSYARPNKRQRPNHSQQPSATHEDRPLVGAISHPNLNFRNQNGEEGNRSNAVYNDFRATANRQPTDVDDLRYESGYPVDKRDRAGGRSAQPSNVPAYRREPPRVREPGEYTHDQREPPPLAAYSFEPLDRSRSPRYDRPVVTMPPPRAPTRILIDEYGREYLEPLPATVVRESAAPSGRQGDSDIRYERLPPARAASQRPVTFEQDGVVYRRISPTYMVPPRRVITQPQPAPQGYRAYREHDYSTRSVQPANDQFLPPTRIVSDGSRELASRSASVRPSEGVRWEATVGYERRVLEDPAQEYMPTRAMSVRPMEGVRYEMPVGYERRVVDEAGQEHVPMRAASVHPASYEVLRDYGTRYGSVRPESQSRPYVANVHPEARRETMPPPLDARSYSARPFDPVPAVQVIRQDYNAHPVEQYYTRGLRPDQDVIYLDHPPEGSHR